MMMLTAFIYGTSVVYLSAADHLYTFKYGLSLLRV